MRSHYQFYLSLLVPILIISKTGLFTVTNNPIGVHGAFVTNSCCHGCRIKTASTASYSLLRNQRNKKKHKLFNQENDNVNQQKQNQKRDIGENVKVGSKEYYSGFISRNVNEEPTPRVTGDAVLIPTLKFVGGFAIMLTLAFVGFLASNGLL